MNAQTLKLIVMSLLAVPVAAQAEAWVDLIDISGTWTSDSTVNGVAYSQSSVAYPVLGGGIYGAGPSYYSDNYGLAADTTQTLRALSSIRSGDSPANTTADSNVGFSKTVSVQAGSGLALGDAVTVQVSLRLDGTMAAGFLASTTGPLFAPQNYSLRSISQLTLDYRITDLDNIVCTDGCGPAELVSFRNTARLEVDSRSNAVESWNDQYWSTSSYIFDNHTGNQSPDSVIEYNGSPTSLYAERNLDTGLLTLSYDTFVGNTNAIVASLSLFTQAGGVGIEAMALDDFFSTFDVEMLVLGHPDAIIFGELAGVSGVSAVPVPAAVWLFGSGLIGLIGVARRKKS